LVEYAACLDRRTVRKLSFQDKVDCLQICVKQQDLSNPE
jgi:hypothetical protein